jgi:pimeloyl-ACP methyl ester carboxylesterase
MAARPALTSLPAATMLFASLGGAAGVADAQQAVSFPTTDGGVVYAEDSGDGGHAVVLAHGGRFTKESWREQARALVAAGLRTLAIDFRGRGRSRGGPGAEADDDQTHLDVLAAVAYLRDSGAERISLVGASFGGWAVARASAELPAGEIDAVVLLAHSPVEHPERIGGRKLFVLARDDWSGSGTPRLPAIRDQYERAPEPKRMVLLEGSAHAQHVFATEQGPRLLEEIRDFLLEQDGGAPPARR